MWRGGFESSDPSEDTISSGSPIGSPEGSPPPTGTEGPYSLHQVQNEENPSGLISFYPKYQLLLVIAG